VTAAVCAPIRGLQRRAEKAKQGDEEDDNMCTREGPANGGTNDEETGRTGTRTRNGNLSSGMQLPGSRRAPPKKRKAQKTHQKEQRWENFKADMAPSQSGERRVSAVVTARVRLDAAASGSSTTSSIGE